MKKYLSILAFSCLTLCSCDNFLDLTPQSVLTPENAYEKPEDWQQTLYAAYGTLQEVFVGKYTITLTEFGTDEVIPFDMGWAAYSQLHYYTFSASHEFLDNHYRLCYEGIKRCNAVIDMPSDAVSADLHNSMIMQARFLRAIYYFDLVRMYGGVPLWTKSSIDRSEIMRPRATVDEVYTLITQDMEAALGLPTSWPNAQDKGRATSYAAQALLARIYLQWGKPEEALNINFPHILNVKNVGVNLNVPVSVIANRPDVKGYQYRLSSAFKNAKATEKGWFPEVTLGGSLTSSGTKVGNALHNPVGTGLIGISLPFLNWNTVKWNVKISEADYETARLNYEQSITKALNDVDTNYFAYTQAQSAFANLQKTHSYNQRITKYYRDRYNAGVSELREWLAAANTEKTSQLSILNAKYNIIQAENAVYSSMAGYYSR